MRNFGRNLLISAILGLSFALIATFTIELSQQANSIKELQEANTKIEQQLNNSKEVESSYEYLKGITVEIKGEVSYWATIRDTEKYIERKWNGTGFIVKETENSTYIITNNHVIGKQFKEKDIIPTISVKTKENSVIATVISEDNLFDMALIKINCTLENKRAVKGIATINPSEKVYLVGHHLGRPYVYGEGVFAGKQEWYDIIQIPVLYGNSGSAVCDKNGKVVSLIFAINRVGLGFDSSHGLGIPGEIIKSFLKRNNILL